MKKYSVFFEKAISKVTKIVITVIIIISLASTVFFGVKYVSADIRNLEMQSQNDIDGWFSEQVNIVNTLSSYVAANPQMIEDYDTLQKYLETTAKDYPTLLASYFGSPTIPTKMICSDGWIPEEDYDVASRDWYAGAMKANGIFFTEPYLDATYGVICMSIAKPIPGTDVVFAIDIELSTLEDTVNAFCTNESSVVLVSSGGDIVVSPDAKYAPTEDKLFAFSDSVYAKNASGGINGLFYGKLTKLNCGYSVYTSLSLVSALINFVEIFVVYLAIYILVSIYIKKRTVRIVDKGLAPFNDIKEKIIRIANCDMSVVFENNTDIKELYEIQTALSEMSQNIRNYIDDIGRVLTQISENDLTAKTNMDYIGDFALIQKSIDNITDKVRSIVTEISDVSEVVAKSADELATTAGSMASNSDKQTQSVVELEAMFEDFKHKMEQIQQMMREANLSIINNNKNLQKIGTEDMAVLESSMNDISSSSDQISTFIEKIEVISEQTNLLSLNASIEAARAGESGKGFAVVAGEISKLSKDTMDANTEINEIIGSNGKYVEEGLKVTESTKATVTTSIEDNQSIVNQIIEVTNMLDELVKQIGAINGELSASVERENINRGLTEDCYARSEELLSSSEILNTNVNRYTI